MANFQKSKTSSVAGVPMAFDSRTRQIRRAPTESPMARFRETWNKTAKVRLAVGFALMAWSAVAASSWAFAVVWWIAAVRAWMAGTWAFLAVDGLLRSLGIKKNAATVALAVGLSVAAILAVPAAEAAESFSMGAAVPTSGISVPAPDAPVSVANPIAPVTHKSVTPETVRAVFADIRSDHPNQNFVTLEQSVRRIEWLAKGIPFEESSRLSAEVPNAGSLVSDSSWKIARAMEKFWFVAPVSDTDTAGVRSAIDAAARKLSPENLEKILLEAYGEEPSHTPPPLAEGASFPSAPEASAVSSESPNPRLSVSATLPIEATVTPESERNAPFGKWAALLAFPAGIAGYLAYRRMKKLRKEPTETRVAESFLRPDAMPVPVPSVQVSEARSGPAYPALALAASGVLVWEYGFSMAASEGGAAVFHLPTAAGEFRTEIVTGPDGAELLFQWLENGKIRYSVSGSASAHGTPDELREDFRKALENAYYETAVFREAAKCEEFREVRIFEMSNRDASAMYRQLEDPDTVAQNRETGGFWFWSGYAVKGGVFRFGNLANPTPGQIDSTSVEFAIRDEHWENYVSSNLSRAFRSGFSPGERKLFMSASKRAERENPNVPPFPLALDFFNWHKHPGAPLGPSGGDINHPDSASGKFEDSPTLPAVTFAIANEVSPSVRRAGEGMPNACVLRGADFWWPRDYLVTFWKLLRISDSEKSKREAFVAKVWKSRAAQLGICDRRGRLLHLDREVRADGEIFEADLRPVNVRIFDERE